MVYKLEINPFLHLCYKKDNVHSIHLHFLFNNGPACSVYPIIPV